MKRDKEIKNPPYTVIGHSCLMPSFELFLRGDSLKKIVSKLRPGEDLRITVTSDTVPTKFEIVDTHDKY